MIGANQIRTRPTQGAGHAAFNGREYHHGFVGKAIQKRGLEAISSPARSRASSETIATMAIGLLKFARSESGRIGTQPRWLSWQALGNVLSPRNHDSWPGWFRYDGCRVAAALGAVRDCSEVDGVYTG